MKKYNLYNLISGWALFFISSVVYLLTIESSASFWDCGEFITTAFKMEVGHPPGAPVFMVFGRLFTLFGGSPENAAVSMNVMTALASAFTILFLFWSITHLAKKVIISDENYSLTKIITIMGAGLIGALAYTFSDTFWFSAVEAEVYGFSSLFTAVVFWAILKWENVADEAHSGKWLILIAYLMGLSIGVHLLNLLTIPAIAFVYYFRKYPINLKGILACSLISVAILGSMVYLIIPGLVAIGSAFELLFTNNFSLPYHTGLVFYFFLLMVLIGGLVYYTHKREKVLLNTIAVSLFMISIGYSSYAVILIRSDADTPLDQSNPETAFSLLRYLNREQYGQAPFLYGEFFNAPAVKVVEGSPTYYKENGKYIKIPQRKYEYDDNFRGFFPRMFSDKEEHIQQYFYWANLDEAEFYEPLRDESGNFIRTQTGAIQFDRQRPIKPPTFLQNIKFFLSYQIGYMYFRYFMWNFAGRQNDLQGQGEPTKGNWISGIKFIDEARLGPQDNMPDYLRNNKARNKYYFLPLILGIIGMIYHYNKGKNDFWIVMMLFLLTGLAIVVYLNQSPLQPRERDYAYAGSFYAFAIWIGLGVAGIINYFSKNYDSLIKVVSVILVSAILVPGIMAKENWDDHDRSGRYFARDFAWNYLQSCEENAILFTNGDNDTFPLWYIQEVEGVRTDVRVSNLSYLTADWYIEQMQNRFYKSAPLPIVMNEKQYRQGTRDYVFFADNTLILLNEKYEANRALFEKEYENLFNRFLSIVKDSEIPKLAPSDYAELQQGYSEFPVEKFHRALVSVERNPALKINETNLKALKPEIESFLKRVDETYMPFDVAMNFIRSDDPRFQRGTPFFPGRKFVMKIDTAALKANGVLTDNPSYYPITEMKWDLGARRGVTKNNLIILDMMDGNINWERPIYFAITASRDNYMGLDQYLHREGLAYRLIPARGLDNDIFSGNVNTEVMYDNVMNKFRWGGIEKQSLYIDENVQRMLSNFRYTFASLANALIDAEKPDSAKLVVDKCMELMPDKVVPFNASLLPVIQIYYTLDEIETANALLRDFVSITDKELMYYTDIRNFSPAKFSTIAGEYNFSLRLMYNLYSLSSGFGQEDITSIILQLLSKYDPNIGNVVHQ